MEKKIYKFQDHRDWDSAYIVAHSEDQATKLMQENTLLEVTLCGVESVDRFPRAEMNKPVPYFYKNNIEMF